MIGANTNPNLFENFLLKVIDKKNEEEVDLDIVGGRRGLHVV